MKEFSKNDISTEEEYAHEDLGLSLPTMAVIAGGFGLAAFILYLVSHIFS